MATTDSDARCSECEAVGEHEVWCCLAAPAEEFRPLPESEWYAVAVDGRRFRFTLSPTGRMEVMIMTTNKNMDLAITRAKEMGRLSRRGDVTLAEEAQRDVDQLVGYWHEGRWCWPAPVLDAYDPTVQRRTGHHAAPCGTVQS